MRYTIITCAMLVFLLGCRGAPRYGGGHHSDEGDRSSPSQSTQPNDPPVNNSSPSDAIDPIKLGEIIDRFLGKPYAGKGETQKGYDCSEFVGTIFTEYASVHLPRTTEKLFRSGRAVTSGDLSFGDLVFFDTGGRGVSHVGIYIGFNEFVHASTSNGIIISSLSDKYYKKRFIGARRVVE